MYQILSILITATIAAGVVLIIVHCFGAVHCALGAAMGGM